MGVRKSLLLSMADSYLGLVLHLASTVILSRLLTPSEVGVFAIAAVFAALASTFRDFGVAEYLIQERELTTQKLRAALALNIAVSWAMAAMLLAASAFAGDFYREPGVADVMRVMALNFVLVPFGAVVQAWFRRELDYRPIVICNLLSSVVAFVVAVGLGLAGWGTMALAWSSFAGIATVVLATAWFRPAHFPRWPSLRGIGEVFRFGKFASLIYILGQIGKGAPELLIGRANGAADVGIFSRANGLVEVLHRLLLRPVLQISMPYFAREDREAGSMAPAYLQSVGLLTAAGWPCLALMAAMSYAVIRIIYGEQWVAAAPLAQLLCLACAIDLLQLPSREALLASGNARRASVLQAQIVVPQILGLLLVFPFGLPGACWGLVGATVIGVGLSLWHLRHVGVEAGALLVTCRPSLVLTVVAGLPVLLASLVVPVDEGNYLRWVAAGSAFGGVAWLLTLRQLGHPLWEELVRTVAALRHRMKRAEVHARIPDS